MHLSNVLWNPDNDYQTQMSNLLLMIDTSVKQVSQTIAYINSVKQTHVSSALTINNIVETSYSSNNGFNNNDMLRANPLLINSPGLNVESSQALIQQKLATESSVKNAAKPNVRSLAANYELHLDHLSDVAYSRESLADQIDAKVVGEIKDFRDHYQAFQKVATTELNSQFSEYNKRLKVSSNRHTDYFNKCKSLEEIHDEASNTKSTNPTIVEESPLKHGSTLKPSNSFHQRSFSNSSARSSVQGSPKSTLQASPFQTLTRTISNAISRQNSDDEDSDNDLSDDEETEEDPMERELNDDPDNFLEKLSFPMRIGATTFTNIENLQVILRKLYKDAQVLERNQDKRGSFGIFSGNTGSENAEKQVLISNHELANWLKLNRAKTENSIKNIESFGQALINHEFLKLSVFRNSIFSSFNSKFQVTNEGLVVVYEFTKLAIFVMNFNLETHQALKQQRIQYKLQKKLRQRELKNVKREKRVWEENNRRTHSRVASANSATINIESSPSRSSKVPDYVEELKKEGISTPKNRSRANTASLQTPQALPKSTSTKGLTNYLSSQLKSLTVSASSSPEALVKKKESIKQNIKLAEEAYKKTIKDVNIAKRNFENSYSQYVINFENYEKKKSHLILNSLNYLSFLLMKQSEYEYKKFSKLNALIGESNNPKGIESEIQNLINMNASYYYSPAATVKFEKHDASYGVAVQSKQYVNHTNLFGSDVSFLPQYNNLTDLMLFSAPILLNEYLAKLYTHFLINFADKLNNTVQSSDTDFSEQENLLELGNYARNSWIQPLNIIEAYNLRQQLIDVYDHAQETALVNLAEEKNSELNSVKTSTKTVLQFQADIFQVALNELFNDNTLNSIIACLKLWMLELPDSLVSFIVFEKLKNLYFAIYNEVFQIELSEENSVLDAINYDLRADESRYDQIIKLFNLIPRSNLSALYLILKHLNDVSCLGFQNADGQQAETFSMLHKKFIDDITNPASGEHNSFPLAHLLLRPASKQKLKQSQPVNTTPSFFGSNPPTPALGTNLDNETKPTSTRFQFFMKNFTKDMLTASFMNRLEALILERENQHQKSLKLKSIKEREAIRSISANNSPVLSRNNVKTFDRTNYQNSDTSTRRSSSTATSLSQGLGANSSASTPLPAIQTPAAPTIMVEGLALRSFGTKHRYTTSGNSSEGAGQPETSEPNSILGDSDIANRPSGLATKSNRQRRKSFSLLNGGGSGIKIIPSAHNSPENSPSR